MRHWHVVLAALLSGLAGVLTTLALEEAGSQGSFVASLLAAGDAAGPAPNPLRIGVPYIPPVKAPDERIYLEEGFEADLAQRIGERLGSAVEVVAVPPAAQSQALTERRVDALIVRVASGDALYGSAQVLPAGYASGLSPVARSDQPLARWEEIAGKVACVTEANEHGQTLALAFGAELRILRAPAQALMLVRTGECAVAIHDRAVLDFLFQKMSWQKFSATLPAVEPTELVVVVAKGRDALARRVSRGLADIASPAQWQKRREQWAATVAFEVYRDQVAADCH